MYISANRCCMRLRIARRAWRFGPVLRLMYFSSVLTVCDVVSCCSTFSSFMILVPVPETTKTTELGDDASILRTAANITLFLLREEWRVWLVKVFFRLLRLTK